MSHREKVHELLSQKIDSADKFCEVMNELNYMAGLSCRYGLDRSAYIDDRQAQHMELIPYRHFNATRMIGAPTWFMYDETPAYLPGGTYAQMTGANVYSAPHAGYPIYMADERSEVDPVFADNFWWVREQTRIAMGFYPMRPNVMQECIQNFRLQQYCIHPTRDQENPLAVVYTPDAAYGRADRQVKVASFGKLLRKLVPLLTDAHVGTLEAAYRANMDPTFETDFTMEGIANVYRSMKGDTGCMRYGHDRWGLPPGVHPSNVYATGEIGVAFHRNALGEIVSRSLIFTKPNGTKGYLRIYGDQALRSKLERAGYTLQDLSGMKIRAIPHPGRDYKGRTNFWLTPYLDGVGGAQSDYNGTMGYIDADDPGFIRLITQDQANRIQEMFSHVSKPASSIKSHDSAATHITPIKVTKFTCHLTQQEFSPLDELQVLAWIGGEIRTVSESAVEADDTFIFRVRHYKDETDAGYDEVWVRADMPTFSDAHGNLWLETDNNRQRNGYVVLDPEAYPNEQSGWIRADLGSTYVPIERDGRRYAIKGDDAGFTIEVRPSNPDYNHITVRYMTAEIAKAMVATGQWVQTLVHRGKRALCKADHPRLVTLRSGRRAVVALHDLVQCYDGTWTTPRMAEERTLLGVRVWVPNDDKAPITTLSDADLDRVLLRGSPTLLASVDGMISDYLGYTNEDHEANMDRIHKFLYNRARSMLTSRYLNKGFLNLTSGDAPMLELNPSEAIFSITDEAMGVDYIERIRAAIDAGRVVGDHAVTAGRLALRIWERYLQLKPGLPQAYFDVMAESGNDHDRESMAAACGLTSTLTSQEQEIARENAAEPVA